MRHVHFHPALRVMEEQYGDAILTTRPSSLMTADALPGLTRRPFLEPRGALWASIQIGGHHVQVINTHLGLRGAERLAQIHALLGPEWLGHPACHEPVVLLGDFNAPPRSRAYRILAGCLRDAQRHSPVGRPKATFPSRFPVLRLDHVFVSPSVDVLRAEVVRTPLARVASDHLPLLVEFKIVPRGAPHSRPMRLHEPSGA